MSLALATQLTTRPTATRLILLTALATDVPTAVLLADAGIPRWDAVEAVRRLEAAGEVLANGGGWQTSARDKYRALLALTSAGEQPAGGSPENALERREEADRPREKALRGGISSLDDAELVALLLRTGSGDEGVLELAERLLNEHGGLAGLARLRVEELMTAKGLGPAKAGELAAACELGRRLASAALRERPVLANPEAAAELLAPLAAALAHEEFWCLPLDPRMRLIGEPRIVARGDVDGTEAPPRAFCRAALVAGGVAAIAVHNHPTGDPTPSAADLAVTKRLVSACRAIDINLQDHLVLGDGGRFISIRRNNPECWR